MPFQIRRSRRPGFTLVELLVVISIISVLTAIGFTGVRNATSKGRDAHRKADLKAISGGLVSYYQDRDAFPPQAGNPGSCTGSNPTNCTSNTSNDWIPELTGGSTPYMQKLPKDPRQASNISGGLARFFKGNKPQGEVAAARS